MTSVTDQEISAFLSAGTRTAKLAFASAGGRPLVTPVWFIVEDGCLVVHDPDPGRLATSRPGIH